MPKAGRRRSVVWECFVEHPTSGKRRVLCRFCQHDTVANPIRMVRHIVKSCPNADETHKRICRQYQSLTVPARRRDTDASFEPDSVSLSDQETGKVQATATAMTAGFSSAAAVAAAAHANAEQVKSGNATGMFLPLLQPSNSVMEMQNQSRVHYGRNDMEQLIQQQQHRMDAALATLSSSPYVASAAMDAALTTQAREKLTMALVTDGVSWSFLENQEFKQFLHLLRPDFIPLTVADVEQNEFPRMHGNAWSEIAFFVESANVITVLFQTEDVFVNGAPTRQITWAAADQDFRSELLDIQLMSTSDPLEALAQRVTQFLQTIPRNPNALLHFCCEGIDSSATMLRELVVHDRGTSGVTFVGGCMMNQSLLLLKDTLDTLASLDRVIEKCVDIAALYGETMNLPQFSRLGLEDKTSDIRNPTPDSLLSFAECVRQVQYMKDFICEMCEHDEIDASHHEDKSEGATWKVAFRKIANDDEFWLSLESSNVILTSFAYLMTLSEIENATSGQILLCWLHLYCSVNCSSSVSGTEKKTFNECFVKRMRLFGIENAVACLILEPHIHGLGLSALGKRKARSIIMDAGFLLNPTIKRPHLVEQLLKYLNRERPFDDSDSWAMMDSMPRLFWMEFMADLPELASVALAVLGYRSYSTPLDQMWHRMCNQWHRHRLIGSQCTDAKLEFQKAQLKHHYQQLHSDRDMKHKNALLKFSECFDTTNVATVETSTPVVTTQGSTKKIEPSSDEGSIDRGDNGTDSNTDGEATSKENDVLDEQQIGEATTTDKSVSSAYYQLKTNLHSVLEEPPLAEDTPSPERFELDWLLPSSVPIQRQLKDCIDRLLWKSTASNATESMHEDDNPRQAESSSIYSLGTLIRDLEKRDMGPPTSSGRRMETVQTLLGTPSARSASPPSPYIAHSVEWSSPTFTRARARPSNLHSYMRANPSFPLTRSSAAGTKTNSERVEAARVDAKPTWQESKTYNTVQSQSTRSTQTTIEEEELGSVREARISLGAYGAVDSMSMETVDFLIGALSERKQMLGSRSSSFASSMGDARPHREDSASATLPYRPDRSHWTLGRCSDEEGEEGTTSEDDERTSEFRSPSPPSAATAAAQPPRLVRSRSFEALVQLESILEARHTTLMQGGLLDIGIAAEASPIKESMRTVMTDIHNNGLHHQRQQQEDTAISTIAWTTETQASQ